MSDRPDPISLALGRRILARRKEMGATQRDIGCLLGIPYQQVQRYECAATKISAAMVWRIAEALAVTAPFLFGDDRERSCRQEGAHAAAFLICDRCGEANEFQPDLAAEQTAAETAGFKVQRVTFECRGVCRSCR